MSECVYSEKLEKKFNSKGVSLKFSNVQSMLNILKE